MIPQLLNTTATTLSQSQHQRHTNNNVPEVVLRNTNSIISQHEELSTGQIVRSEAPQEEEEADLEDNDEECKESIKLKEYPDIKPIATVTDAYH